jgi:hypothetical protein
MPMSMTNRELLPCPKAPSGHHPRRDHASVCCCPDHAVPHGTLDSRGSPCPLCRHASPLVWGHDRRAALQVSIVSHRRRESHTSSSGLRRLGVVSPGGDERRRESWREDTSRSSARGGAAADVVRLDGSRSLRSRFRSFSSRRCSRSRRSLSRLSRSSRSFPFRVSRSRSPCSRWLPGSRRSRSGRSERPLGSRERSSYRWERWELRRSSRSGSVPARLSRLPLRVRAPPVRGPGDAERRRSRGEPGVDRPSSVLGCDEDARADSRRSWEVGV